MGYTFFSSDAQRTSINTESKFLLLQYAFETLGVKRVQIKPIYGIIQLKSY